MIQINKEKCTGCSRCINDCPGGAIKLVDQKAESYRACITCGHCVAVCPENAVTIPEYDMAGVEEYQAKTFQVKAENFLHAVKFRRSIRNFENQPLQNETVERIIEAGRYTATAKNTQGCTFIYVQEHLAEFKELLWAEMPVIVESLKESAPDCAKAFSAFLRRWQKDPKNDTFFFNTPSILVVAATNPIDVGLAMANVENMAVAEGAGVLYSGYLMKAFTASPVLQEWLGVDAEMIPFCMLLGTPAVSYRRTAPRKPATITWK